MAALEAQLETAVARRRALIRGEVLAFAGAAPPEQALAPEEAARKAALGLPARFADPVLGAAEDPFVPRIENLKNRLKMASGSTSLVL